MRTFRRALDLYHQWILFTDLHFHAVVIETLALLKMRTNQVYFSCMNSSECSEIQCSSGCCSPWLLYQTWDCVIKSVWVCLTDIANAFCCFCWDKVSSILSFWLCFVTWAQLYPPFLCYSVFFHPPLLCSDDEVLLDLPVNNACFWSPLALHFFMCSLSFFHHPRSGSLARVFWCLGAFLSLFINVSPFVFSSFPLLGI